MLSTPPAPLLPAAATVMRRRLTAASMSNSPGRRNSEARATGIIPEQLFAAGYAACFLSSMQFVASQGGPKVPANAEVQATVRLGPRSEGGFGLEIALDITLPGLVRGEAEALIEKAHQVCPYSNATRNNVAVKLSLTET